MLKPALGELHSFVTFESKNIEIMRHRLLPAQIKFLTKDKVG